MMRGKRIVGVLLVGMLLLPLLVAFGGDERDVDSRVDRDD